MSTSKLINPVLLLILTLLFLSQAYNNNLFSTPATNPAQPSPASGLSTSFNFYPTSGHMAVQPSIMTCPRRTEPSHQDSSQPPFQSSYSKLFDVSLFTEYSSTPGGRNRPPVQPSSKVETILFINFVQDSQLNLKIETCMFVNLAQHSINRPGGCNRS